MRAEIGAAALLLMLASTASGQIVADTLEVLALPSREGLGSASYDLIESRDPFLPLTGEEAPGTGPRFEQLTLTGIFEGAPGRSLVVLEDPSQRGWFVRVGEEIADAQLIEIRPDAAVFDVREYGAVRREILRLERIEESP